MLFRTVSRHLCCHRTCRAASLTSRWPRPVDDSNLVIRALKCDSRTGLLCQFAASPVNLRLFREKSGIQRFFDVNLEKTIPAQARAMTGLSCRGQGKASPICRPVWVVEAAMQRRRFSELLSDVTPTRAVCEDDQPQSAVRRRQSAVRLSCHPAGAATATRSHVQA